MNIRLLLSFVMMLISLSAFSVANAQVEEANALARRLSGRLAEKVEFKQGKAKGVDYFTLKNEGDKV